MAAILNSAILNLAIFDSAILVFPLKLTHTCQDWVPPFAQRKYNLTSNPTICKKKLHSFILTQLNDGSHLQFCNVGFRHLVFFSQIHSKHSYSILTLTQINLIWLKLIHSHLTWWWQPSWIWPSYFSRSNSLTLAKIGSHHMHKNLHSFNLIQLDDGSHLELCHLGFSHFTQKNFTHSFWLNLILGAILNLAHVGFRHWHLGFRHLGLLSVSCKNTLTSSLTMTQINSVWLKLIHFSLNLLMATILNLAILNLAILVFPLKFTHTCQDLVPTICTEKLHSFILTQLDDGSLLEFGHLRFSHLSFSSQNHSHWPRLVTTFSTKKNFTHTSPQI